MSEQICVNIKARKFERLEGELSIDYIKRFIAHKGVILDDFDEREWKDIYETEMLYEFMYKYFDDEVEIVGDTIFEILEKQDNDDCDIYQVYKDNDGDYNFTLSFYNGACSTGEAMERAIKKLEE